MDRHAVSSYYTIPNKLSKSYMKVTDMKMETGIKRLDRSSRFRFFWFSL